MFTCGPAFYQTGPASDPFFSSVLLLGHFDGTNGATSFVDSSSYNRVFNGNGTPTGSVDTSIFKWGTGSLTTIGTTSYGATGTGLTDFNYGTSDLTIEFWYMPSSITLSIGDAYSRYNTLPAGLAIQQRLARMHLLASFNGSTWGIDLNGSANVLTPGVWSFVQLVRAGGVFNMNVGGVLHLTSSFSSAALAPSTFAVAFGNNVNLSSHSPAHFDDIRITKGVARANVVPTGPFPNQ